MSASDKIRRLLSLYLGGVLLLQDFSACFGEIFNDIEDSHDQDAIILSYQVESILARASEGFLSAEEFASSLAGVLNGVSFSVSVDVVDGYRKVVHEPQYDLAYAY